MFNKKRQNKHLSFLSFPLLYQKTYRTGPWNHTWVLCTFTTLVDSQGTNQQAKILLHDWQARWCQLIYQSKMRRHERETYVCFEMENQISLNMNLVCTMDLVSTWVQPKWKGAAVADQKQYSYTLFRRALIRGYRGHGQYEIAHDTVAFQYHIHRYLVCT